MFLHKMSLRKNRISCALKFRFEIISFITLSLLSSELMVTAARTTNTVMIKRLENTEWAIKNRQSRETSNWFQIIATTLYSRQHELVNT